VREKVGEAVLKRGIPDPKVSPEGSGGPVGYGDFGDGTKGAEPSHNVLPDGGVEMVGVSQISGVVLAVSASKPGGPGSSGVRV
jgi:hypothetical protein